MKSFIRILLFVLAIFAPSILQSQQTKFGHLLNADGLQNNNINCMIQDLYGYLWIGTENGLHRYNGIEFELFEYEPHNPNTISGNAIFKLIETKSNNILVFTNNGISLFDRKSSTFMRLPAKLNSKYNTLTYQVYSPSACKASNDKVYVSLGENGIFQFSEDSLFLTRVNWKNSSNQVNFGVITSMFQDSSNYLWLGSQTEGLFCIDLKKQLIHKQFVKTKPDGLTSNIIYAIDQDAQKRLWIGAADGLYQFNPVTETFNKTDLNKILNISGKTVKIYTIGCSKKGEVWFGSNGNGLIELKNNAFVQYQKDDNNPNSLNSNFIRAILKDKQENLWIGTYEGGINYLLNDNSLVFKNITEKNLTNNGLTYRSVTTIEYSPMHQGVWVGTDGGGIDLFEPLIGKLEHLPTNGINSILTIQELGNELWFGGYLEGLSCLNLKNNKLKTYRNDPGNPSSLGHNDVRDIYIDHEKKFWVATNGGGISIFDPKTESFKHLVTDASNPNSLVSNYCLTMFEDTDHSLWIGTYNGFSILDSTRTKFTNFIHQDNKNSLSVDWVYCFHKDSKQRMWIGTSFGLNLFNRSTGEFKIYTKKDGLPGNEIMGILEDEKGILWISTNNGISQFDVAQNRFTNFDISDGLIHNQFIHGAFSSFKNQLLFFGSGYGISYFDPKTIKTNRDKPPIYLTQVEFTDGIMLFNTHTEGTNLTTYQRIKIPFKSGSYVRFKFDALNFISAKKNNFKYKLDGFDENWIDAENRRYASYANLKPGKYVFSVIGSNNNNVWNPNGAKVELIITPPFFRSIFAKTLYFLLIAALIYLFYRLFLIREGYKRDIAIEHLKLEKTEELARLKTDFFINVSHELSTPLTLIMVPLERLEQSQTFNKNLLKAALNNTRRMHKLVSELLDFQKIEDTPPKLQLVKNEMVMFVKTIIQNFQDAFNHKNIELELESNQPVIYINFDTEMMEKIIYNLISNALKYSNAGDHVKVEIKVSEQANSERALYISVADNGIGIPLEKQKEIFEKYYRVAHEKQLSQVTHRSGYGIGLYTTKKLVNLHQGDIWVESAEGKGSKFIIKLPYTYYSAESMAEPEVNLVEDESGLSESQTTLKPTKTKELATKKNSQPTLLIVEDNLELVDILIEILESKHHLVIAHDGVEGLKQAHKHMPDLIITDIMMPIMDGFIFTEKIKNNFYTSHIPVIMLTALNQNEHKISGYQTGADAYISKPFNTQLLESRVSNLLESRKNLQKKFLSEINITPSEITVTTADEDFMENAIKKVELNIENPEFSVVDLASLLNMSEASLYRKLKAVTSQAPNLFIRTIRLKRAAQLLKTSKYSIPEIVSMVGLNDVKYFRKCFQKQFGLNPTEYVVDSKSEPTNSDSK